MKIKQTNISVYGYIKKLCCSEAVGSFQPQRLKKNVYLALTLGIKIKVFGRWDKGFAQSSRGLYGWGGVAAKSTRGQTAWLAWALVQCKGIVAWLLNRSSSNASINIRLDFHGWSTSNIWLPIKGSILNASIGGLDPTFEFKNPRYEELIICMEECKGLVLVTLAKIEKWPT